MKKILSLLLVLPLTATAAPINIGVASAVRGAVNATAPGAAGRVVETGKSVYSHDKVTTGPEGKLQVLLLDQTSFTMGPNSEMELDEFVFDPNTNVGKVSAKITKGAFRFITGKVARRDPASMQVTTPVGTIGIRGTITAGNVNSTEGTFVLLGPGPENNADEKAGGITIKNGQGSTEVDQDGWGVTVKLGEAPSKPFALSGGQLDGILSGLASVPKGDQKDDNGAGGPANESSGQNTASGKSNAKDAFAAIDASEGDTSQFASQQFNTPTPSTWESIIAIPGGSGKYAGSAPFYQCVSGGACGGAALGTMDFVMNVDFAAKTVGSASGSTIVMTSPASSSSNINVTSYAGRSGAATMPLNFSSGQYSGTVNLLNAGGVTAGAAVIDVRYNSGSIFGGSVGGSLQ